MYCELGRHHLSAYPVPAKVALNKRNNRKTRRMKIKCGVSEIAASLMALAMDTDLTIVSRKVVACHILRMSMHLEHHNVSIAYLRR